MDLETKFSELHRCGEHAFMPYVSVGYPDEDTTLKVVDTLVKAGADVIELGLPFSDPIADGATIQESSQRSLDWGMNTDKYFRVCSRISKKHPEVALVSMSYYNLALQYGLDEFTKKCVESGVSGVIVPDLPAEESGSLKKACRKHGIDLIFLVALTTSEERTSRIFKHASGFIYLVSLKGVTGARDKLNPEVKKLLSKVRNKTRLPVCLGFGISKPQHVREAVKYGFDGVIVGSALVKIVGGIKNKRTMLSRLHQLASKLKHATVPA